MPSGRDKNKKKDDKKKQNNKSSNAKKQMVKAGYEYLKVRKNKPTSGDANIANYQRNLDKARKNRDSLRVIVRKGALKR